MKVLLVTMYFPPAGGGGVQRPLKIATHLPALGIETHVLAPDDPKWIHRDEDLRPPTQAFVHRARYLGPRARLPSEEMHGLSGTDLLLAQAKLAYRRVLLPDASVTWLPTAVPTAVRIVKSEGIDAVITTSPPNSMHLLGASVKRLTGIPWVADFRDAVLGNADRRFDKASVRAKEKALEQVVRLVARSADGIVAVSEPIADEVRSFEPGRPGARDPERLRLRRLRRARVPRGRALPDHAHGELLRPAQSAAVPDRARRVGPRRRRRPLRRRLPRGRPRVGARSSGSATGSSCSTTSRTARRSSCSATRRRTCCCSRRRPAGAVSSRPGRSSSTSLPSGRSSPRCRPTAPPPSSSARPARGSWSRPTTSAACARRSPGCTRAGAPASWPTAYLSPEQRKKLSRETRVQELAELLWSLQGSQ